MAKTKQRKPPTVDDQHPKLTAEQRREITDREAHEDYLRQVAWNEAHKGQRTPPR